MADFNAMTIEELEAQLAELQAQITAVREVKVAVHAALERKVIAERTASQIEGLALPPVMREAMLTALAASNSDLHAAVMQAIEAHDAASATVRAIVAEAESGAEGPTVR